jgi:hypothetical protein
MAGYLDELEALLDDPNGPVWLDDAGEIASVCLASLHTPAVDEQEARRSVRIGDPQTRT